MTEESPMVSEGRRICEAAERDGLAVRLLGGTAIWLRASPDVREVLTREFADVDLVTVREDAKRLRELLERLGYVPDKMFNATQGSRRLYFTAADATFHLDVFVDRFVMSHELDLGARLRLEPIVLPAAELLLTKLQVAELNQKDAADAVMLLLSHELVDADGPGQLNVGHVASLCAESWGLYTTVTDNLEKIEGLIDDLVADETHRELGRARIAALHSQLQERPKSGRWRRRARIGRRVRWYETPDEV